MKKKQPIQYTLTPALSWQRRRTHGQKTQWVAPQKQVLLDFAGNDEPGVRQELVPELESQLMQKRLELPTNMDVPEEMTISTFKHDEILSLILFLTALPLLKSL